MHKTFFCKNQKSRGIIAPSVRQIILAFLFLFSFEGGNVLLGFDVVTQGKVELPISGDDLHVFQFSSQKIHSIKRSDFASPEALKEEFAKLGDLYVAPISDRLRAEIGDGFVHCYKSQQAFYPLLRSQFEKFRGSSLSPVGKTKSPFNLARDNLFGLDTQGGCCAFIHVDEIREASVVLSFSYRNDNKSVFAQIPGEGGGHVTSYLKLFERARRLIEWRRWRTLEVSDWWKDLDSPAYQLLQNKADKESDVFSVKRQLANWMKPAGMLAMDDNFRKAYLRDPILVPILLARFEKVRAAGGGEESQILSEALLAIGRPASAMIIQRLLKPEGLSGQQVESLKELLDLIEGDRTLQLMKTPPVPTFEKQSQRTGSAVTYKFGSISRTANESALKPVVQVISPSKGPLFAPVTLGTSAKSQAEPELYHNALTTISKTEGVVGILGQAFLVPSKRYAVLASKSFRFLNGVPLSPLILSHDEAFVQMAGQSALLFETYDKQYGILQETCRTKTAIFFCMVTDGADGMSFEIGPSPLKVWEKYSEKDQDSYMGYFGLLMNEMQGFGEENASVLEALVQIANGSTAVGVDPTIINDAVQLLGVLRHWEAAGVIIIRTVEDKLAGHEVSYQEKLKILHAMLPYSANKTREMIPREQDSKKKSVLQAISKYLETEQY